MFSNLFSASPLVWAGLIAGFALLPILIHLINLMRHRRVKWAAMEFLLKSYKKQRNWIWLKQLLLLVARVAALLLALFMLGQVGCDNDRIASIVGGNVTHHYVLLDDSFSMEDRVGESRVFDRARTTLLSIASRAKDKLNQRFTLLRFSRAAATTLTQDAVDTEESSSIADINGETVDSNFESRVEEVRSKLESSHMAVGPESAIETVEQMLKNRDGERAIVYIVSDFREKDWGESTDLPAKLESLNSAGAEIELVRCANTVRENLAITEIKIDGNLRVAGFPFMMNVSVKNLGKTTAEKVQIKVSSFEFAAKASLDEQDLKANGTELPTVFVDKIAPGETQTRKFMVFFGSPGQHVLQAHLTADAVTADNSSWQIVEVFPSARVLLIDGPARANARLLATGLEPNKLTGIKPDPKTEDFLRDAETSDLESYDAIIITDVSKLSESSIRNLEAFVTAGGGLGIYVGPETNREFYNRKMYRDGMGLMPMPLDRQIDIPELIDEKIPNIGTTLHPIMRPFVGLKNSPLGLVQIRSAIRPPLDWSAEDDDTVEIAATIRGRDQTPLVVTRRFGKGNVALITTTAGPIWNNWIRNESFPLFALMLHDWLAAGRHSRQINLAGNDLSVSAPSRDFQKRITFTVPAKDQQTRRSFEQKSMTIQSNDNLLEWTLEGNSVNQVTTGTLIPGLYEAWITKNNAEKQIKRWAVNVDTAESDLAITNTQRLASQYSRSNVEIVTWNEFDPEVRQSSTSNLGKVILVFLIALLIAEQLLAYSASYHPRRVFSNSRAA